jgi:hypothetical protein
MGHATNNAAHTIATMATMEELDRTWRGAYPDCIHETILRELFALSL